MKLKIRDTVEEVYEGVAIGELLRRPGFVQNEKLRGRRWQCT